MTPVQWIFLLSAAVTLVAAVMVVASPRLVHAALWLIATLAGVAVIFVLLNASFLAVVQVAIYIDAIAILIMITIMLTRQAMRPMEPGLNRNWLVGALAAALFLGAVLLMLYQMPAFNSMAPELQGSAEDYLEQLGKALVDVDRYILPFEVASVLLVAALIGAIVVAIPPRSRSQGGER